jgi:glycosyltransferase involved in cell wall biosynthesis
MRILVLPRYTRLGASSRVRLLQYEPLLRESGMTVHVSSLFGEAYVALLQKGRRNLQTVVAAYARRLACLLTTGAYDLLWIEKECLPWVPYALERLLLCSRVPYVLDYDDAVFHGYEEHRSPLVRKLLSDKHPSLMRGATLVIVGNPYLRDFAVRAGARRVEMLPSVIDLRRYPEASRAPSAMDQAPVRVGWVGQRSTAEFLRPLAPVFEDFARKRSARFVAVGIDAQMLGLPMESIPWSEETEVQSIGTLDVGVMPMADAPFERGKCGYKLIQYMGCGLPVIASPVGVNSDIVEPGVNGFLARTPDEWRSALARVVADPELRRSMGRAGRAKVERSYCLQVTGPRLVELLKGAAARAA